MTDRTWELITHEAAFEHLMLGLQSEGSMAALDFETTGLDVETSEVRLAQICNDDVWVVVDFWALPGGSFEAYAHHFVGVDWYAFNAGFEYKWFVAAGADEVVVRDVAHLRRARMGGDKMSLAQMLKVDLDIDLPKDQQVSNWAAKVLSDEQLEYAADDALYTWDLVIHWLDQIERKADDPDAILSCADMFDDLVPCVHEMQDTGLVLDIDRHLTVVEAWEEKLEAYNEKLRAAIPEDEVANLNSGAQLSDLFSRILPDDWLELWPRTDKSGQLQIKKEVLNAMAAVAYNHGAQALGDVWVTLGDRITVNQYLRNFGHKLVNIAKGSSDGRIRASYNIARAVTGRFSSSAPNMQQYPRDRELLGEFISLRKSIIAPAEKLLVSLDYSGIELRVLALLSGDEGLLHDCVHGDVHLEVGSIMAGRRLDKSIQADKEIRSNAKGVSFGIIYGSGAGGLSVTLRSTFSFAEQMIDSWAARYPKAFALRHTMAQHSTDIGFLPMVDGGTIFMKKPYIPACANYPVQRAALSIMARAIIRHKATLDAEAERGRHLRTRMAATIHDALIDEAAVSDADDALLLMKRDMVAGYLDVFPGAPTEKLLEGGVGPSWGELEDNEI